MTGTGASFGSRGNGDARLLLIAIAASSRATGPRAGRGSVTHVAPGRAQPAELPISTIRF